MNIREAIEYFHLFFSHRLTLKVDRKLFCLKGGCNLRFYYQSFRYSEDIDFDVQTTSVETLKKNVEKILKDDSFRFLLKNTRAIEIVDWSAPKQTETTQRWKVNLKMGGQSLTIPTKIEFSRRRAAVVGGKIEPIPSQLISMYKLQPILLQHYQLSEAIEQKIGALVHRTETQARDVIDLKILKDLIQNDLQFKINNADKQKAIKTLASITFDQFKSQVWPYIMANYQEHYGMPETWIRLQEEVIKLIDKLPGSKP
ncbi:MAG: nucleotidyl transferase AbiEii/AbiGii toxin family protein [Pseudomonadota bacterium]|nr:nucleotidyl transferase AbiEii/AbiGii toxin family protein [Pseudomonadota bacterium]